MRPEDDAPLPEGGPQDDPDYTPPPPDVDLNDVEDERLEPLDVSAEEDEP